MDGGRRLKAYAEKTKAWMGDLGIDDKLVSLMITSDAPGGLIPKVVDYETLEPVLK